MTKSSFSFAQIWSMSFGFLGIQFGFALQFANMSAIYAKLGADPSKIPILWLAGPMTGLPVQPIIGSKSGRTWDWLDTSFRRAVRDGLMAFALVPLANRISRLQAHALTLLLRGVSLLGIDFIHYRTLCQYSMAGVGIAWASMAYAMLRIAQLAALMGVYMDIFNLYIVLAETVASLKLESAVKQLFHNDPAKVVMFLAAALGLRVTEGIAAQGS